MGYVGKGWHVAHYLKKRCPECKGIFAVRRPTRADRLIPQILALIQCPACHPEAWRAVCPGCALPFTLVKRHANGHCNACAVRDHRARYKPLPPASV